MEKFSHVPSHQPDYFVWLVALNPYLLTAYWHLAEDCGGGLAGPESSCSCCHCPGAATRIHRPWKSWEHMKRYEKMNEDYITQMNLKKIMAEKSGFSVESRWDRSTGKTKSSDRTRGGHDYPMLQISRLKLLGYQKIGHVQEKTSISKLDHFDICIYIYTHTYKWSIPTCLCYTLHAITSSPSLFWRSIFFYLPFQCSWKGT